MLIAVMCVRNEEYYLPSFLKHIRKFVDGFVVLDDGSSDNTLKILENEEKVLKIIKKAVTNKVDWDEAKNRKELLRATYNVSPDKDNTWVLCCDPDERFEIRFLKNVRRLCKGNNVYGLHFREIHNNKNIYRCDGIWNEKKKYILFPLKENMNFDKVYLNRHHIDWFYNDLIDYKIMTDYDLYHLKMLKKSDRIKRVNLYNEIDPNKKMQVIGYDYLIDESNAEYKKIKFKNRYKYCFIPNDLK